jgi:S1-C subfamily serine protease
MRFTLSIAGVFLLCVFFSCSTLETRSGRPAGNDNEYAELPPLVLPVKADVSALLAAIPDESIDEIQNILIYEALNEAVVNITTIITSNNWFMQPVPQEGTGSGSIIDEEGRVLTNYHVIKGARELIVTLADGQDYEAKVVGSDPENDLAIIQFNPEGKLLVTIPLGASEGLKIGQKVLAIGNPFGFERTLTTGIVSGLGRPVQTGDGRVIQKMIQTDASINPGNSGGPLLNSKGEMIGINTVIYSTTGGSVGVGFAVPIEIAKRVVPELLAYGEVRRGWIDISPIQLFSSLVRVADLPVNEGVLISAVKPNSLAAKAGLKGGDINRPLRMGRTTILLGGDIIVEIDGMPIKSIADLYNALEDNKPGETVDVLAVRDKTRKTFQVTLSERP